MRTYLDIIKSAGSYKELAAKLGLKPERVRFWERRESIPTEHWRHVAASGIATLEELAEAAELQAATAAEARRLARTQAPDEAA